LILGFMCLLRFSGFQIVQGLLAELADGSIKS
jgi:hypothetical protein